VTRRESGRLHVYTAAQSRDQTQRHLVRDLLQRAFRGSAAPLVLHALAAGKASPDELNEIRQLIEKHRRR
jgi:predicted transcriptional regulator